MRRKYFPKYKVEKQGMHLRHVFELVQRPAASVESPAQALMPLLLGHRIALFLFLVIGTGRHNSCIEKTPSTPCLFLFLMTSYWGRKHEQLLHSFSRSGYWFDATVHSTASLRWLSREKQVPAISSYSYNKGEHLNEHSSCDCAESIDRIDRRHDRRRIGYYQS
jgi:hypothetical protein